MKHIYTIGIKDDVYYLLAKCKNKKTAIKYAELYKRGYGYDIEVRRYNVPRDLKYYNNTNKGEYKVIKTCRKNIRRK